MTVKLLVPDARNTVLVLVAEQFSEDDVLVDVSLIHLPSDADGLLPMMVIYVQCNGTDQVDGLYLSEVLPPSAATEANLGAVVAHLADASKDKRQAIRDSLAAGDTVANESLPIPIS